MTGGERRLALVLAAPSAVFMACFYLWPMSEIARRAFSWSALVDVVTDGDLRQVLWFTTWQAAVSALGALVLGLPIAWVLGRYRFTGRRAVEALLVVPFTMPTVVTAAALRSMLPSSFDETTAAVLVAHVLVNVAVVVRLVAGAVAGLDPAYLEAARTLGAGRVGAARRVVLPLLGPTIIGAVALVYAFCFSSFGLVVLLGDPRRQTIEVQIFREFGQLTRFEVAAALSAVQLVVLVALLAVTSRWQRRRQRPLSVRQGQQVRARPRGAGQWTAVVAATAASLATVLVPVGFLVERSLSVGPGHGLDHYRALGDGVERPRADPAAALWTSMRTATAVALVATVLAITLALALARVGQAGRWSDAALTAPLATSAITLGFAYLITFDHDPVDLRAGRTLLVAAHVVLALPFALRVMVPAVDALGRTGREAAATLGASPWQALRWVELPLLRRPMAVTTGFAFAISLGEFGSSALLSRVNSPTAPALVARLLSRPGEITTGAACALAVCLAALTAAVTVLSDRGDR